MKTKILYLLWVFSVPSVLLAQTFTTVDFQAGGYVTEIYAPTAVNGTLYARTDVGGMYRSEDGGDHWVFISQFAETQAPLMVQGLAILQGNPGYLLAACGNWYLNFDPNKGVWKSTDFGSSWSKRLTMNFGGNLFESKAGGECIVYEGIWSSVAYVGGRFESDPNSRSPIYRSNDYGDSWFEINPLSLSYVQGNVSSIIVNPVDVNEIWIATNFSVWKGTNILGNYIWEWKGSGLTAGEPIYRIVMKNDGTLFLTQGKQIFRLLNGSSTWEDRTRSFDPITNESDVLVGLMLFDDENPTNPNNVLASRTNHPTKISYDNGESWPVEVPLNLDQNSWPKHVCTVQGGKTSVFYARNNFSRHPFTYQWYLSGGAGPYRSQSSDITGTWEYMTNGINIPVIYNVTLSPFSPSWIYVPLADWTMARIQNPPPVIDGQIQVNDYARNSVTEPRCDYYISNSTRVLFPNTPGVVYMIGGNLYKNDEIGSEMFCSFLRSDDYGNTFYHIETQNFPLFQEQHTIIDGLVADDNPNEFLLLVGGGDNDETIGSGERGIWRSTNGIYFEHRNNGINSSAKVGELFSHQVNLGKSISNLDIRYLYLEGGKDEGGIYISGNRGDDWSPGGNIPVPYYDKGCLKVHPSVPELLYLAIQEYDTRDGGFFRSYNGGNSWEAMPGSWLSARQVDAIDNKIVVFGRRNDGGGNYNQIYLSVDNGSTWNVISNPSYFLPSTCHLTFNPGNTNEIWISTAGQGVFVYNSGGDNMATLRKPESFQPLQYSLRQNYPNPFNPSTTITYSLASRVEVNIKVYNMLGQEIIELVNGYKDAGTYKVSFDGSNLPSGIYVYRIETQTFVQSKKMLLIK